MKLLFLRIIFFHAGCCCRFCFAVQSKPPMCRLNFIFLSLFGGNFCILSSFGSCRNRAKFNYRPFCDSLFFRFFTDDKEIVTSTWEVRFPREQSLSILNNAKLLNFMASVPAKSLIINIITFFLTSAYADKNKLYDERI